MKLWGGYIKATIDNHTEIANGLNLVRDRDDGVLTTAPAALVPILVKAIQELSAEVETLKSQIGD